jgi:SnoaL-like domain
MKTIYFLTILAILFASGCTDENNNNPDPTLLVSEVEEIADKYLEAWNAKDINTLDQMTADDGEYYGSDPEEIMDKPALLQMYSSFFEDPTSSYKYTVELRKIRITPDANEAIIMERIIFPEWSAKMPMCQTTHLINTNGNWKIDFISWGFIIKNDDVVKVNEIL